MQPLALFDLAFRKNEWLSVRQSVVAMNVANANTPGFKAKDISPFEAVMESSSQAMSPLPMATTSPAHFVPAESNSPMAAANAASKTEVLHSGNDVSLEEEFLKSGDIMKQFSLNSQVTKTFNRMLLASSKG